MNARTLKITDCDFRLSETIHINVFSSPRQSSLFRESSWRNTIQPLKTLTERYGHHTVVFTPVIYCKYSVKHFRDYCLYFLLAS